MYGLGKGADVFLASALAAIMGKLPTPVRI